MNRLFQIIGVWVLLLFAGSCLIQPPPLPIQPWSKAFDFAANTPIRNMHATPVELQVISDDEFIRLGPENVLKERRIITVPFEFYGRPIMSDHTFTRLVRTQPQGGAEIEIHISAVPGEMYRLTFDDLKNDDTEVFIPVAGSVPENPVAYNESGGQLIVPVINFSGNMHTFFLLNINLDFSNTRFEGVTVSQRVDIPELPASTDRLTNVVFSNGNYYAITKDGTFRITPDGTYSKVIDFWMFDVFEYHDTLFATNAASDMFFSLNNGSSWVERDSTTMIRYATVVGERIFSQRFPRDLPELADSELENLKSIVLNDTMPGRPTDAYSNILYFYNGHYLSIQKELYQACGISVDN